MAGAQKFKVLWSEFANVVELILFVEEGKQKRWRRLYDI